MAHESVGCARPGPGTEVALLRGQEDTRDGVFGLVAIALGVAMLHGAIAWLVAVPFLVVLASLDAAPYFGGWYGGLAGLPPAAAAQAVAAAQDPAMALAAGNAALAAVTALLLGLMGGVVGGWMGSGQPMTFTHYRTRRERAAAGGW